MRTETRNLIIAFSALGFNDKNVVFCCNHAGLCSFCISLCHFVLHQCPDVFYRILFVDRAEGFFHILSAVNMLNDYPYLFSLAGGAVILLIHINPLLPALSL